MRGWSAAGVRTEETTLADGIVEAPLLLTENGEILPMVVRFPHANVGEGVGLSYLGEHDNVAESLVDAMHEVLSA